ncbi:MAG TPA: uroporphyrinogen-III synthase, partial [Ktedonobacteraceae bacterium]|nr:uroporphyrinogen-III synthase [Ktedonobacteraceae bacterium]
MSERGVKLFPLQGKRILVTRTRQQAGALSERLRALGAIPIEFPTIHIVPPQDWEPLDSALRRLCMAEATSGRPQGIAPSIYDMPGPPLEYSRGGAYPHPAPYYTWLVFTSANGVNICFERLHSIGYDARAIGNVRVAAIGPATAAALACYGVTADLVPDEYIAEGVAAALIEDARQRGELLEGKRILLARAEGARKVLVTELRQAGAVVDEVVAYRTSAVLSDDEQGREVLHLLYTHQLDILTFTSSSTVRNFLHWLVECAGKDETVGELGGIGPTRPRGLDESRQSAYVIASLGFSGQFANDIDNVV